MPNTRSAAKALRQSKRKREHNLMWKRRIDLMKKSILKSLKTDGATPAILNEKQSILQKVVDKAVKGNVIHKNKGNRIKSSFSKKISAHGSTEPEKSTKSTTSAKSSARGKSASGKQKSKSSARAKSSK